METRVSILKKIDLVMLTRNPIDKGHDVGFQVFLTEKEMSLIKRRLKK